MTADRKLSNVVAGKVERDGRLYPDDVDEMARRWGVKAEDIQAFAKVYKPLAALDRALTDEETDRVRLATEKLDGAAARVSA